MTRREQSKAVPFFFYGSKIIAMNLFHLEHRAVRHKLAMPRSFAGPHNKYASGSIALCEGFSPSQKQIKLMKEIIIAISLLFSTVVPGYAFDERHDPIPEQRPITRALTAIGECTPESSIIMVSAGETKGFHKFCKEALYVNFSNGRVLVLFNPPDNLKNEPSVGLSGLPAAGDLPAVHIDHMKVGDLEVDASGLCVRPLHNQIICNATFVKNDGDVGLVSMIMKYKVFIDVTKELAN